MSWVSELLNRYQQQDLRFKPYTPMDDSRQRFNPRKVIVQDSPFDPSSYYNQLGTIHQSNQAATREQQVRTANRIQLEQEARFQSYLQNIQQAQQRAVDLAGQYSYQGSSGFGKAGSAGKSGLLRPLNNYSISSNYGMRTRPGRGSAFHSGIDLAAAQGTPIYATHDGYVSFAGWNGGHGIYVHLDSGSGLATSYSHQAQLNVKQGQYVTKGQVIGFVGSTGDSTGPHLHYEVYVNGQHVNPIGYL